MSSFLYVPLLMTQRRQLNVVAAEKAQHEPHDFWFSANLASHCAYTLRESCAAGILCFSWAGV